MGYGTYGKMMAFKIGPSRVETMEMCRYLRLGRHCSGDKIKLINENGRKRVQNKNFFAYFVVY